MLKAEPSTRVISPTAPLHWRYLRRRCWTEAAARSRREAGKDRRTGVNNPHLRLLLPLIALLLLHGGPRRLSEPYITARSLLPPGVQKQKLHSEAQVSWTELTQEVGAVSPPLRCRSGGEASSTSTRGGLHSAAPQRTLTHLTTQRSDSGCDLKITHD